MPARKAKARNQRPSAKLSAASSKTRTTLRPRKLAPKVFFQPPSALYNHSLPSHSNTGTLFSSGITMTADSKWRPTLFGQVQTGTASVKDVELQTACPSWNRWACFAASCVSVMVTRVQRRRSLCQEQVDFVFQLAWFNRKLQCTPSLPCAAFVVTTAKICTSL